MVSPYRKSELPSGFAPESELCLALPGSKHQLLLVAVKAFIGVLACSVLVSAGVALGVVPMMAGIMVWGVWDWRRNATQTARFEVRLGRLSVRWPKGLEVELPLRELLNVRLDTKTIQKPLGVARSDGLNSAFGAAIVDHTTHRIGLDVSRIELVTEDNPAMLLSYEHVSKTICSEWLRSIRLFLRKHGWLPEDERPEEEPEPVFLLPEQPR